MVNKKHEVGQAASSLPSILFTNIVTDGATRATRTTGARFCDSNCPQKRPFTADLTRRCYVLLGHRHCCQVPWKVGNGIPMAPRGLIDRPLTFHTDLHFTDSIAETRALPVVNQHNVTLCSIRYCFSRTWLRQMPSCTSN
jgi:hypothetical protein